MNCPLCSNKLEVLYQCVVLDKFPATLFKCNNCKWCGFPSSNWLDSARSSPISVTDTGLVARNINISVNLKALLIQLRLHDKPCLDKGGGYGLLVRLMRDLGFDFYWEDPYAENLFARGFEQETNQRYEVVTLFEAMEHIPDPGKFFNEIKRVNSPKAIIMTTEIYTGDCPANDWWYLSLDTGQHISFYAKPTMEYLAMSLNMKYFTAFGFHVLASYDVMQEEKNLLKRIKGKIISRQILKSLNSKIIDDHRLLCDRVSGSDH